VYFPPPAVRLRDGVPGLVARLSLCALRHLIQFTLLGTVFSSRARSKDTPEDSLESVGEKMTKGVLGLGSEEPFRGAFLLPQIVGALIDSASHRIKKADR
jgi:hypothetical protein